MDNYEKEKIKMALTKKERLELGNKLRSVKRPELVFTHEYEKNLDMILCEEKTITTREGESRFYIITPKENMEIYPLYINLHGGGFIAPYGKRDTLFCSRVASKIGCKVIDIDYKLSPDYTFPTALYESYDIVKWAIEHAEELKIDIKRIAVGGHSAGGNLAAGIALMANQNKEFDIKLQIMDFPALDLYSDPEVKVKRFVEENGADGASFITSERAKGFNALYLENEEDKNNPLVSPVCAKKEMLIGLPTALVITAGKDTLCYEAEKYANMLVETGTEVTIKRFVNSNHGFTINCMDEYEEAQLLIIETLAKTFDNI